MIEKILERLAEVVEFENYGKPMIYLEDAQKIIKEESKNDGWIPCSERLPEDRTEVLAWFSNPNMHSVAWYSHEHKVWFSNDFVTEDSKYVLAWQPLPAPYQKGE